MALGRGRAMPSRGEIAVRCLLATAGAYAAGWTYTAALSLALIRLGIERANAVAWATLTAYAVMVAIVPTAFSVRSLARLGSALAACVAILIVLAATIGGG